MSTSGTVRSIQDVMDALGGSYPPRQSDLLDLAASIRAAAYSTPCGQSIAIVGDSINMRNNQSATPSAVVALGTAAGSLIQVTQSAHGLLPGARIFGFRADQDEWNGLFRVASVIDSSNFLVVSPVALTTTTPSFTRLGSAQYVIQDSTQDNGCFTWLNAASGSPFWVAGTFAYGGELASNFASYITKYVIPLGVSWVFLSGGVNDASAGQTGTQIAASLQAAVKTANNAGIRVLFMSTLPWSTAASGSSTAKAQAVLLSNKLMREYIERNPMNVWTDGYAAVVNPSDTSGAQWASNYDESGAGLHPAALAAWAYGTFPANIAAVKKVTSDIRHILLPSCTFQSTTQPSSAGAASWGTTGKQLVINPLMTGTAGTVTGLTGTTPDNYNTSKGGAGSSGIASIVPRGDGFGNNLRVAFTATALNDNFQLFESASVHANVSAGQQVMFACEVSAINCTNLAYLQPYLQQNAGTSQNMAAFTNSNTTYPSTQDIGPLVIRSNLIEVTPGTLTNFRIFFKANFLGAGGAVVEFGRLALWIFG